MESLSFFTPVRYRGPCSLKQRIEEWVEGYFHLGGRSAYVVPGKKIGKSQEVVLEEKQTNVLLKVVYVAIKVFSYLTFVIPTALFLAKVLFRATHKFHTTPLDKEVNQVTRDTLSGPTSKEPVTDDTSSVLDFYTKDDQITFWECYLGTYTCALNDDSWNTIQGLLFLNDELHGIKETLSDLKEKEKASAKKAQSLINEIDSSLKVLSSKLDSLMNHNDRAKPKVKRFMRKGSTRFGDNALPPSFRAVDLDAGAPDVVPAEKAQDPSKVKGLMNCGNTCYMNAALQPLLAIADFETLVPEVVSAEPAHSIRQRQAILDSFKDFLEAWNRQEEAGVLGSRVGKLRKEIFEARLQQGGFIDTDQVEAPQDSGQFFELILHVLGRGFEVEMTRTPVMDDERPLVEQRRIEQTPEGVMYLKYPGCSVQEMVEGHRDARLKVLGKRDKWRVPHPKPEWASIGGEIEVSRYEETQKIVGEAPEILVVRVNSHVVNPELDRSVDFEPLFKDAPENSRYELVGFAQNLGLLHWTSVVFKGSGWVHCNDSRTRPIRPTDAEFLRPANYMVYRRTEAT